MKNKLFIVLFLFFLVSYCFIGIQKHNRFETTDDLTIYSQSVWHYSNFDKPYSTLLHNLVFNDHFGPILVIFAPFYKLWPSPMVLILGQQLIIVLGAIPVYLYSKKLFGKKFVSIIFSFLYLYFIGVQSAIWSDFHLGAISAGFLSFTIYFLETKKRKWYWLFLFLSLLCREDVALYTFALGIYSLIFKRESKTGILTIFVSILYFYCIDSIFLPILNAKPFNLLSFGGGSGGVSHAILSQLQDPVSFIKSFFTPVEKIRNIFLASFSFGFMPFLSPLYWIIAPFTYLRYLIGDPAKYGLHFHYAASLTPILTFSAINFLYKIKRPYIQYSFLFLAVIGTIYTNRPNLDPGYPTPPISFLIKRSFWVLPAKNNDYYQILKLIPKSASVSAQVPLLPHLSNRDFLYRFPDNYSNADYIALTFSESPYPINGDEMEVYKKKLLASPDYIKLYQSFYGVLLKRSR